MPRDPHILQLDWLRAFATIAKAGTFTRAAELLHVSQPALSRKIHHLEEHIGCKLIERKAAPVTRLTPAGERLLADSFAIFAKVEELHDRLR